MDEKQFRHFVVGKVVKTMEKVADGWRIQFMDGSYLMFKSPKAFTKDNKPWKEETKKWGL